MIASRVVGACRGGGACKNHQASSVRTNVGRARYIANRVDGESPSEGVTSRVNVAARAWFDPTMSPLHGGFLKRRLLRVAGCLLFCSPQCVHAGEPQIDEPPPQSTSKVEIEAQCLIDERFIGVQVFIEQ